MKYLRLHAVSQFERATTLTHRGYVFWRFRKAGECRTRFFRRGASRIGRVRKFGTGPDSAIYGNWPLHAGERSNIGTKQWSRGYPQLYGPYVFFIRPVRKSKIFPWQNETLKCHRRFREHQEEELRWFCIITAQRFSLMPFELAQTV
jgi:hypothetical protein